MRHALAAAAALLLLLPVLAPAPASALLAPSAGPTRTWPHLTAELAAYSVAFPDLAKLGIVGRSVGKLELWSLTLKSPVEGPRQRVLLDGNHHGNEQWGGELVLMLVRDLLEGYGTDPWATQMLDTREIVVVPMVNPDGNALDERKNLHLVDLNRNYPHQWGGPGSSPVQFHATYRGPTPMSEPEAKAMVQLVNGSHWDLWVTMHSGVAALLWPWGYTTAPPPDQAMFQAMGAGFTVATSGQVGAGQASVALYLASGIAHDHGYSRGVPSLTFEVHAVQNVPAYADKLLLAQYHGLRFLLENVERMGAQVGWASLSRSGDEVALALANHGWGATTAHVVAVQGGAPVAELDLALPAGGTAVAALQLGPGPASLLVSYPELAQPGAQVKLLAAAV